ncbi:MULTISPECIES: magnesium and cobalt transport protein CorA [unclassified Microbacterium]|uniref:magnesium and cobalt transport protein CorA n=1 Tax=unclassified Microbacterium TaxID=2609290 RepID=UPI0021A67977|nr:MULTISPECIES: magnesium and cobalt transport protein CorA [unclassified Microbacterium]MCT1364090.1 magnesium and cobalt transport protein CorA [Microbacterium sp. p3-SID131]MCT1375268.1 magnesium and cobalt transport protein CorA [Microbacterium sp. p3-SID337]
MPIIDNGVYVNGLRIENPASLEETFEHTRAHRGFAWIGLLRPTVEEIQKVAEEFDLHPLAVEDTLTGHQRAKLERYGDVLFAVLRPARYIDSTESVDFGELHIFVGPAFVITVRHADVPDLARVRRRMESHPQLLALGPEAVLYAIMDEVVDQYAPVADDLQSDIDEVEDALFGQAGVKLSRRIYDLAREAIIFQRATQPLLSVLEDLLRSRDDAPDVELQRRFRDVQDHVLRINDRVTAFRAILDNILTLNATLVSQRQADAGLDQNEQVKKISAWAAILFGPTLVGTVYGMNFTHMPELEWPLGYPLALLLMAATSLALYATFKHKRWL